MARVLVVEDEAELAAAVAARLRADGHEVVLAATGPDAVAAVERDRADLLLLDLLLPGFDGLEVCRQVRARGRTPIIMLTALGSETDRVVGLELGADDYLTKPFSMRELTARVRAVLRRAAPEGGLPPGDEVVEAGGVRLDLARRTTTVGGLPVDLTLTEFDLLAYLLRSPGVVRSRDALLRAVWGYPDGAGPRTVDSHVRSVRRKVGAAAIRTVHGIGYAGGER